MKTYVSSYYPRTVLETANELEVKQKISELLKTCCDENGLFHDPEFGPCSKDPKGECAIFYPPEETVELQGDASVGVHNNIAGLGIDMIKWLRPKEFCQDPTKCSFVTFSDSDEESEEDFHHEEVHSEGEANSDPHRMHTARTPIMDEEVAKDRSRGASSLDVMQGNLGDCWFISALILIATRDDIFDDILCEDRFDVYEKHGLYVFRMHRDCKVFYIIIDDKIPCMERSSRHCIPAFARCRNPNEFWVSMIEKAYAKLNIRYINLTSGFIDEALQDLSGLAPEMIKFSSEGNKDAFWENLKMLSYNDSLIGASLNFLGRRDIPDEEKRELQTEAKHKGIQYGHAYGILDVREVEDPRDAQNVYRFLRIRNPWGKENNLEWNGDWADEDPQWTPELKKMYNKALDKIPTKFDKEEMIYEWGHPDNMFIMCLEDFMTYFNTLMAVRDFPPEWSGVRYYTAWNPSYGIPPKGKVWYKNPQFPIYIKKPTTLVLMVQQPDPRSVAENRPPYKKFVLLVVVFKIDMAEHSVTEFDPKKIVMQSQGADSRSVMVNGELKPGKYCAVLFNANEGAVCDCFFSIYFNCSKEDIVFENKNWEIITEEENDEPDPKEKLVPSKGIPPNKSEELKTDAKKEIPTIPLKKSEIEESKIVAKKEIPTITVKKSEIEEPKIAVNKGFPIVTQKKGQDEEHKTVAFGKTISSSSDKILPAKSYSQALKDIKSNIQITEAIPEEAKVSNPQLLEIQFETEMATLLGLSYSEYKEFYNISVAEQQKIIDQYNIDKNRTKSVLDLNYFGLGTKGLSAVFPAIEDFSNLEYLYLKSNKLTDTSVCELCRRLELSRQFSLKEIDLSENNDAGDTAGLALFSLATKIKSITKINLEKTSVTAKVIQKVNEQTTRNAKSIKI